MQNSDDALMLSYKSIFDYSFKNLDCSQSRLHQYQLEKNGKGYG